MNVRLVQHNHGRTRRTHTHIHRTHFHLEVLLVIFVRRTNWQLEVIPLYIFVYISCVCRKTNVYCVTFSIPSTIATITTTTNLMLWYLAFWLDPFFTGFCIEWMVDATWKEEIVIVVVVVVVIIFSFFGHKTKSCKITIKFRDFEFFRFST